MKQQIVKLGNKKTMFRFLATYMCVVIPILLISIFVSFFTINSMKDKEYAAVHDQLNTIVTELDGQFVSYRQNSVRLSTKLELLPHNMLDNAISAQKGIELLDNVSFFDAAAFDIFMYYGTQEVFSAKGRCRMSVYFADSLYCTPQTAQTGMALLEAAEEGLTLLRTNDGDGYLFLHFPIQTQQEDKTAHSVNFCITLAQIGEILNQRSTTNPAFVNLIFSDGTAVHYYGDAQKGLRLIPEAQYPDAEAGKKFTQLHKSLSTAPISVQILYQTDSLFTDVRRGQTLYYFILVYGIFLSTGAAWVISKRRYQQINSLEQMLEHRNMQVLPEKSIGPELDHVRSMIAQTIRQSNEWQQSALSSYQTLKMQTASMLFQGFLKEPKMVSDLMQLCGLEPIRPCYFLGGVQMDCSEEIRQSFRQLLSGDLYCEVLLNGRKTVLFLLSVPDRDFTRRLRMDTAGRLGQLLNVMGARKVRIALSHTYTDLNQADMANMEVTALLERMAAQDSDQTLIQCPSYSQQEATGTLHGWKQDMDQFAAALAAKSAEEAIRLLRSMTDALKSSSESAANQRYLRYCILQPLIQEVNRVVSGTDNVLVEALMRIDPSDEPHFFDSVAQIIRNYCAYHSDQDDFEKIIAYIEKNFSRDNLTQEEIADYAGISRTAMSKLFRAKAGICYIDYITELRMRKAKDLLLHTDLPVAEVFQKVGYVTRSNYTRKFKEYYGINASDIRKGKNDTDSDSDHAESTGAHMAK